MRDAPVEEFMNIGFEERGIALLAGELRARRSRNRRWRSRSRRRSYGRARREEQPGREGRHRPCCVAEEEGVEAEAELLAENNAEARANEKDNHAPNTILLLKNTTNGAGAFVLGKLLFGRAHSRKEGK